MRNIIFYGPLGIAKNSLGGGESGNKKTLGLLESAGFKIFILEKPYLLDVSYLREIIAPFQFLFKIAILIVRRFGKFKDAKVFHVSAFYYKLMFFEYLFISISNKLGLKTVYEIRAGGMINAYKESSYIYKKLFYSTVKKADLVLCQGTEYCDFLSKHFDIKSIYYPNYISTRFIKDQNVTEARLKTKLIQLVYFGRLTETKRIDLIINIAKCLKDQGVEFNLNLIGSGKQGYIDKIKSSIDKFNLSKVIVLHGRMSMDEMSNILINQHFFLFPSAEFREGHSNSLTEAMSFGIVPLVSDIGFNRSIVNEDQLVLGLDDASNYANKLTEIFNDSNAWKKLSNKMHTRILENYTEPIVSKSLIAAYNKLF
jgi:glycosyltransferase involved in cell wall biosynthesis